MAVKRVWGNFTLFERGAPSYTAVAGMWQQINFKDIYEAALMTGAISPATFIDGQSALIPAFYFIPDPINCLIPAVDFGRSRKHTYLSQFTYSPPEFWMEVPPVSGEDAQVLFVSAMLPDMEWQLVSKFPLGANEPFALALVLTPAVKDNLSMPFVEVIFGGGEWRVLFRPEVEPILIFRDNVSVPVGHVFGEIWSSSPIWRFEGAVGALLFLPIRGHLCVLNARQFNPTRPQFAALNPYLFGKGAEEPIVHQGPVIIRGRGASAFIAFPSVDFSLSGAMFLPQVTFLHAKEGVTNIQFQLSSHLSMISVRAGVSDLWNTILNVWGTQRFGHTTFTLYPRVVTAPPLDVAYSLHYQTFGAGYFELVSLAFHTFPTLKYSRLTNTSIPFGLGKDFNLQEVTIDTSEEQWEARLTFVPRHPNATFPTLSADRYAELTINWENLKGQVGSLHIKGFVKEVTQQGEAGSYAGMRYSLRLQGVEVRLKEAVGDYSFPIFDGATIKEVFEYCLLRVGLDPAEVLHFHGQNFRLVPELLWMQPIPPEVPPPLMPQPPVAGFPYWWIPEEPRWTIRPQQSLWEFLKEIARMSGNEVIADIDGIWVIPTATEAIIPLHDIADASLYQSLVRLRDELLMRRMYFVERVEIRGETGWMPTTFVAVGKTPFGAPIHFFFEDSTLINDPTSTAFKGFRASEVIADDKLASDFFLFRAAFTSYLKAYAHPEQELSLTLTDIPVPPLRLRSRVRVLTKLTEVQELVRLGGVGVARPNEWIVRRLRYHFSAKPEECHLELTLSLPANIPTGIIFPR